MLIKFQHLYASKKETHSWIWDTKLELEINNILDIKFINDFNKRTTKIYHSISFNAHSKCQGHKHSICCVSTTSINNSLAVSSH